MMTFAFLFPPMNPVMPHITLKRYNSVGALANQIEKLEL